MNLKSFSKLGKDNSFLLEQLTCPSLDLFKCAHAYITLGVGGIYTWQNEEDSLVEKNNKKIRNDLLQNRYRTRNELYEPHVNWTRGLTRHGSSNTWSTCQIGRTRNFLVEFVLVGRWIRFYPQKRGKGVDGDASYQVEFTWCIRVVNCVD